MHTARERRALLLNLLIVRLLVLRLILKPGDNQVQSVAGGRGLPAAVERNLRALGALLYASATVAAQHDGDVPIAARAPAPTPAPAPAPALAPVEAAGERAGAPTLVAAGALPAVRPAESGESGEPGEPGGSGARGADARRASGERTDDARGAELETPRGAAPRRAGSAVRLLPAAIAPGALAPLLKADAIAFEALSPEVGLLLNAEALAAAWPAVEELQGKLLLWVAELDHAANAILHGTGGALAVPSDAEMQRELDAAGASAGAVRRVSIPLTRTMAARRVSRRASNPSAPLNLNQPLARGAGGDGALALRPSDGSGARLSGGSGRGPAPGAALSRQGTQQRATAIGRVPTSGRAALAPVRDDE